MNGFLRSLSGWRRCAAFSRRDATAGALDQQSRAVEDEIEADLERTRVTSADQPDSVETARATVGREDHVGTEQVSTGNDECVREPQCALVSAEARGAFCERAVDRDDLKLERGQCVAGLVEPSSPRRVDERLGVCRCGQPQIVACVLQQATRRRGMERVAGIEVRDHDARVEHYQRHSRRRRSRLSFS